MSGADTIHASAVVLRGRGVLIRGASGSGKSSLVLALLDRDPEAAMLVADDRVALAVEGGRLVARAPQPIAGKLEVRGQGIFELPFLSPAGIDLVVDLLAPADCPRLPNDDDLRTGLLGVALPRLKLPANAPDGAIRVRFALSRLKGGNAF